MPALKYETCPRCSEVKRWLYDAQLCARCYYPDRHHEIMRAEQSPDMYDGQNCDEPRYRWVGSADGDKDGDGEIGDEIVLAAKLFPPGTRIAVEVPLCPKCRTPRDLTFSMDTEERATQEPCDCGFDWSEWDARYT